MMRLGAALCQLWRIVASPLATIITLSRSAVPQSASCISLSDFAAFKGSAQLLLKNEGAGNLGSLPGIFFRNHGQRSLAKPGLAFMACTCTSIIGGCFLVSCAWLVSTRKANKKVNNKG